MNKTFRSDSHTFKPNYLQNLSLIFSTFQLHNLLHTIAWTEVERIACLRPDCFTGTSSHTFVLHHLLSAKHTASNLQLSSPSRDCAPGHMHRHCHLSVVINYEVDCSNGQNSACCEHDNIERVTIEARFSKLKYLTVISQEMREKCSCKYISCKKETFVL